MVNKCSPEFVGLGGVGLMVDGVVYIEIFAAYPTPVEVEFFFSCC